MTTKRSYKIEQDGENFVLVETSDTYGNPVVRVPYSIQQEAESGIIAVSKSQDSVKIFRKNTALDVARDLTDFFIKSDLTAESLLKIRQRVEVLITASIAEIRKNAGIVADTDGSAGHPLKGETAEQYHVRKQLSVS